ncbi:MAG: metallophosphoesterase [Candidatus Symbiothrix sp.]|jgi:predicted MPP superfamily phosphohydrolase|nr:metallophosphoesterase [Candidatus Symbiothrix sp.]
MAFFILAFLVHTSINLYIFYRGWKSLPASFFVKIAYSVVFLIFYSSFIIAMLGRNSLPLELQKVLYFIGTCWLGAMVYLLYYFLITDLLYGFNRWKRFLPKALSSTLFHHIQVISGYAIVLVILLFGYHKFTHPSIVEQEISIAKTGGKYKELKVVAFSDTHLGVAIDKKRLQKYVQLINAQQPDIIWMAGDMIDNNALPLNEEKMYEEINQLQAPLGVYFCLGNHEYLSSIGPSMDFLRKTNMTLLIDSVAQVDDSFWMIGRNDKQGGYRKPLKELVAQTDSSQPVFLLDHEPYFLEDAVKNGIDLQFSGHTHNGQLWPFNYIVKKIFEIGHGYKPIGNTQIYVSSGLGLWGPPFRVGTQSEIVIFNIKFY